METVECWEPQAKEEEKIATLLTECKKGLIISGPLAPCWASYIIYIVTFCCLVTSSLVGLYGPAVYLRDGGTLVMMVAVIAEVMPNITGVTVAFSSLWFVRKGHYAKLLKFLFFPPDSPPSDARLKYLIQQVKKYQRQDAFFAVFITILEILSYITYTLKDGTPAWKHPVWLAQCVCGIPMCISTYPFATAMRCIALGLTEYMESARKLWIRECNPMAYLYNISTSIGHTQSTLSFGSRTYGSVVGAFCATSVLASSFFGARIFVLGINAHTLVDLPWVFIFGGLSYLILSPVLKITNKWDNLVNESIIALRQAVVFDSASCVGGKKCNGLMELGQSWSTISMDTELKRVSSLPGTRFEVQRPKEQEEILRSEIRLMRHELIQVLQDERQGEKGLWVVGVRFTNVRLLRGLYFMVSLTLIALRVATASYVV